MTLAAFWFVNTVHVQTYLGTGSGGAAKFGTSTPVQCWVEDGNKLVRDSTGAEVVSSTSVHGPLDQAGMFTVGSKVTTPAGLTSRVLTLSRYDSGSLAFGIDHFVAHLT